MNTQQLETNLSLQLAYAKELQKILELETQALIDRNHDNITTLAQKKQQVMEQLQTVDQQIATQIPQGQSLPEYLNPLKQQILELIAQCQEHNQQNGYAIDLSINSLERLKRAIILKRSGNSMTYNAKGKEQGGNLSGGYISA